MNLIEHYLSIQGEGLHSGKLTYFVRFARCNLRCSWCDSAYTFGNGSDIPFNAVATAIKKSKARFVCLTGGEPLLHKEDCLKLIRAFPRHHFDIETGGSLDIRPYLKTNTSIIMDWKLKSSGMGHKMNLSNLERLRLNSDLIKLVTDFSKTEIAEMKTLIRRTEGHKIPLSIQPVYGTNPQKITEWAIALKNPRVQINLQLHKLIWPHKHRGV